MEVNSIHNLRLESISFNDISAYVCCVLATQWLETTITNGLVSVVVRIIELGKTGSRMDNYGLINKTVEQNNSYWRPEKHTRIQGKTGPMEITKLIKVKDEHI